MGEAETTGKAKHQNKQKGLPTPGAGEGVEKQESWFTAGGSHSCTVALEGSVVASYGMLNTGSY